MADDVEVPLSPSSDDLFPLPTGHRRGLAAITVLATLSVASSTVVLLYLTVKLVRWHLKNRRHWKATKGGAASTQVDLSLGLHQRQMMDDDAKHPAQGPRPRKKGHPNQFLVLLYNLLLADIHQSLAFLLNAVWVSRDGILVRTSTCWVQGWLVLTGDLSSSLFITAVAAHTYGVLVWNYQPPQWALYTTIVGLWAFNYLMAILGVAITHNGEEAGGFFVRAAAWCWVNIYYENLRLLLHYLWIFLALALTSILYTLIFFSLRTKARVSSASHIHPAPDSRTKLNDNNNSINNNNNNNHQQRPSSSSSTTTNPPTKQPTPYPQSAITPLNLSPSHHQQPSSTNPSPNDTHTTITNNNGRAFLLYPLIYLVCTLPLCLGRIATMAGADVPIAYFNVAGALITSNGWLDVLLWGVTRHELLFGSEVDAEEVGVETFAFMRTPHGRRWGNIVWVEGGGNNGGGGNGNGNGGGNGGGGAGERSDGEEEGAGLGGWVKRRMGWRPLGLGVGSGGGGNGNGAGGGGGLAGPSRGGPMGDGVNNGGVLGGREDGLAIQMDVVTAVVVEPAQEHHGWTRGPSGRGGSVGRGGAEDSDSASVADDRSGRGLA